MSSPTPTQTIFVKDLSTRSVTLYSSGAHIVRDLNDLVLKPGINEVEIIGLNPAIDENSVQVDGKGAATVVDMTVELVPNREVFEEVYPDDDGDETSDEEDDTFEDSDDEPDSVKELSIELKDLKAKSEELTEKLLSAQCRLQSIDAYLIVQSKKTTQGDPDDIHKVLKNHEQERGEIFKAIKSATTDIAAVNKKMKRKENEGLRASKEARKTKAALKRLKAKEERQKALKKAEKIKAAQYEKDERLRYWPKQVYKVALQLETNVVHTPTSSRRGSIGSVTLAHGSLDGPPPSKEDRSTDSGDTSDDTIVSLSLSYVTKEAAWTPRYDIDISSTKKSATIVYRTEFVNHTSETWRDAKISFSTSQTSYQGLNDSVPQMDPWKVKLTKEEDTGVDGGLLSNQERWAPRSGKRDGAHFDRHKYFGRDGQYVPPASKMLIQRPAPVQEYNMTYSQAPPPPQPVHQPLQTLPPPPAIYAQGLDQPQSMGMTNTSNHALQDYQMQLMLLEQQNKKRLMMARQEQDRSEPILPAKPPTEELDIAQMFDFCAPLEFPEPTWEDNGLTTTYEIPQPRTLPPGSQTRRYKIASLNATDVNLSYIAVPKLRSAVFLLAKIRNPSANITLLKGSAGVTLDGSYLGNMSLPQVSPSQTFQLSFGVDPCIQLSYPKPSTKRSTQGLFTKERTQVYTRNIWLTNSKNCAIDLVVLEQIPISEEERLRIDIISPRGLHAEGDVVENVGVSAKEAIPGATSAGVGVKSSNSKKWGSALARLKKNGEVAFAVRLEPNAGCLLKLEYEAKMPTSEQITMV
jgi:hypothetical protein